MTFVVETGNLKEVLTTGAVNVLDDMLVLESSDGFCALVSDSFGLLCGLILDVSPGLSTSSTEAISFLT